VKGEHLHQSLVSRLYAEQLGKVFKGYRAFLPMLGILLPTRTEVIELGEYSLPKMSFFFDKVLELGEKCS